MDKILVFTTLFPNSRELTHGVFVKERIRYLGKHYGIKVVAPVHVTTRIKSILSGDNIPSSENMEQLEVFHPTFYFLPGLLKFLDGIFLFISSFPSIYRLRKHHPFTLIDAHYAYPDGFAAILFGRVFKVPVSVTIRGSDVMLLPKYWARRGLIKYTLRKADVIISVSHGLREEAIKLIGDSRKIEVVMNSVDHEVFQPISTEEARNKLDLKSDMKVILSIGALRKLKGFHYLIDAFKILVEGYSHKAHLYIIGGSVGEKSYEEYLRTRVKELGLEQQVVFVGPVSHRDVALWYSAADIFCLLSEWEGCPNVLVEAIACGLPSVVCGNWVDRNMIPSDEIGFVSPTRDPEVLSSVLMRALIHTWDREKIRNFSLERSWDEVARQIRRIFETEQH